MRACVCDTAPGKDPSSWKVVSAGPQVQRGTKLELLLYESHWCSETVQQQRQGKSLSKGQVAWETFLSQLVKLEVKFFEWPVQSCLYMFLKKARVY